MSSFIVEKRGARIDRCLHYNMLAINCTCVLLTRLTDTMYDHIINILPMQFGKFHICSNCFLHICWCLHILALQYCPNSLTGFSQYVADDKPAHTKIKRVIPRVSVMKVLYCNAEAIYPPTPWTTCNHIPTQS